MFIKTKRLSLVYPEYSFYAPESNFSWKSVHYNETDLTFWKLLIRYSPSPDGRKKTPFQRKLTFQSSQDFSYKMNNGHLNTLLKDWKILTQTDIVTNNLAYS